MSEIIVKKFVGPLDSVVEALDKLTQGDLSIQTDVIATPNLECKKLVDSVQILSSTINSYINEIDDILDAFADGNFTKQPTQNYIGDFGKIKVSLIHISNNLKHLLANVRLSADGFGSAVGQIASSALELDSNTTTQSNTIMNFKENTLQVADNIINVIEDINQGYAIAEGMAHKAVDGRDLDKI